MVEGADITSQTQAGVDEQLILHDDTVGFHTKMTLRPVCDWPKKPGDVIRGTLETSFIFIFVFQEAMTQTHKVYST